jgi:hypothetical protein
VLGEEFDPEPRWREKLEKEKNKMRKSKGGGGEHEKNKTFKGKNKELPQGFFGFGEERENRTVSERGIRWWCRRTLKSIM